MINPIRKSHKFKSFLKLYIPETEHFGISKFLGLGTDSSPVKIIANKQYVCELQSQLISELTFCQVPPELRFKTYNLLQDPGQITFII